MCVCRACRACRACWRKSNQWGKGVGWAYDGGLAGEGRATRAVVDVGGELVHALGPVRHPLALVDVARDHLDLVEGGLEVVVVGVVGRGDLEEIPQQQLVARNSLHRALLLLAHTSM